MSDDRMGEMHVIHQTERVDPEDHDAVINQCDVLMRQFLLTLHEANGYSPMDVVGGTLWGLVAMARKLGVPERQMLGLVVDCFQRHKEQEEIDAKAKAGTS